MALAPSSPRLPSPPPAAEIQMGPKSPSGAAPASPLTAQMEQSVFEANSRRRIHPGTKSSDMAAGPPLVPLNELDSAFQLQEHLAALHYHHTALNTQAITREAALQLAQPPTGIDRTIWLYELCRFLISQCNSLIIGFLFDAPPCSATTCPEMRASEWQFLCAVHEQPKSCCAIDYCCHTLDWAANVVSDQKLFPSRFAVLNDAHSNNTSVKNLINVFRRLHRIFAHAWFQHRSVFWSVEARTGLYILFKLVCDLYDLLPAENYKLPPEAEGLESQPAEPEAQKLPHTILKPPSQQRLPNNSSLEDESDGDGHDGAHHGGRTNTRRHIRSSPSTGSSVTTVMEADEEDSDQMLNRMQHVHVSGNPEPEVAEVPVVVEQSVIAEAKSDRSAAGSFSPRPSQSSPKLETRTDDADNAEADGTIVGYDISATSKASEAAGSKTSEIVADSEQEEPKSHSTTTNTGHEAAVAVVLETDNSDSTAGKGSNSDKTSTASPEDMTGESGQVTDPE